MSADNQQGRIDKYRLRFEITRYHGMLKPDIDKEEVIFESSYQDLTKTVKRKIAELKKDSKFGEVSDFSLERIVQREKTAAVGQHPRRIGRGNAHRARTKIAHGCRRDADGIAVQVDRPRIALQYEPERAECLRRAAGDEPEGHITGVPRPPHGCIDPPQQLPAGQDRAPPRNPRRAADRLPESGRADPHHPPRGRAQAHHHEKMVA